MKWKSHLEIASALSDQLGLPNELRNALRQGSIQPDREGDKVMIRDGRGLLHRRRMRHHRATRRFIKGMLWKARVAHLEGREADAMWCLGRALHYIQDRSLAVGPFGWFHDQREGEIGRETASLEAIQLGEMAAVASPLFVELCLRSLSPKRRTSSAMHQACMLSSAMAFAVLSDPKPDRRRVMELERSERRHAHLLLPFSLGAAMFVIMVGFTLDEPLIVLFSLPLSAIALMLDSRLLALRSEVRWSVPL
ncbi:MAG: hypothetical protein LUQ39_08835 [Methanomassiliicoccales archaeon]|jgi:hypothetical protein|nr:hypothetical protein [Methanomassiliicoccales archaeon]